jgi:arsenite methyltransferase
VLFLATSLIPTAVKIFYPNQSQYYDNQISEIMENNEQLKKMVKEKYADIAEQSPSSDIGCCGTHCGCASTAVVPMAENYSHLQGYLPEADLGLGCGLPTEFAMIKEGDIVIDLGSGAGNDAFVARSITGSQGKVIGVDITESMIAKAQTNAKKLSYENVEFRLGDIENLPLASKIANVVVSNCVLNLVPDKEKAFEEIFRITKPGGHFSVSDIVIDGELPENLKSAAEMYAGCISSAITKEQYLEIVRKAEVANITVQKERVIDIPEDVLKNYLSKEEIERYRQSESRIISMNLYAERPLHEKK